MKQEAEMEKLFSSEHFQLFLLDMPKFLPCIGGLFNILPEHISVGKM